jgi:hypothetical protein
MFLMIIRTYQGNCVHLEVLSQNCKMRHLASPYLSVCPSAWNKSAHAGPIFVKLDI